MRILLTALSLLASLSIACAQGRTEQPTSPATSLGRALQPEIKAAPIDTRAGGNLAVTKPGGNPGSMQAMPISTPQVGGEAKPEQEKH